MKADELFEVSNKGDHETLQILYPGEASKEDTQAADRLKSKIASPKGPWGKLNVDL